MKCWLKLLFLVFLFKTVYVSNIPYTTRWGDLKDLFREKVGDILYCEVFEKNGKSLGIGAIEFNTQTDAERAVKIMNKYEMGKFILRARRGLASTSRAFWHWTKYLNFWKATVAFRFASTQRASRRVKPKSKRPRLAHPHPVLTTVLQAVHKSTINGRLLYPRTY